MKTALKILMEISSAFEMVGFGIRVSVNPFSSNTFMFPQFPYLLSIIHML